jgi:hypothetical protein
MELKRRISIGNAIGGAVLKRRDELWLASGTLLLAGILLGYLLIGGILSAAGRAGSGTTTGQAAAQAGAKVLPPDPKLKVEPK